MLRVSDLLDWIASPKEIHWDRGLKGVCEADCKPLPGNGSENNMEHQYDKGLNAKFSPGHSEFLSDVRQEKETIGKKEDFFFVLLLRYILLKYKNKEIKLEYYYPIKKYKKNCNTELFFF